MKMPKLAKDLAGLIGISRKETDLDTLAAAVEEARGQVAAVTAERGAADAAYRERILDASPAELEKLQAAKARATVDLDRAEALVAALTQRIATVREDQERAARKAVHDDATAKCDAIRARLPEEYRVHALAIRALLRDLAEAEAARERAEPFMGEFGAIPSPETEPRGLGGVPEDILDRREVELWTLDGRWEPIPEDRQREVIPDPRNLDRGKLPFRGSGGLDVGVGTDGCARRRYIRVRYREAVAAPSVEPLSQEVNLPAFDAYGDAFVVPERYRGVSSTLEHLSREIRERPALDREVQVRFELIRDLPPDDTSMQIAVSLGSAA